MALSTPALLTTVASSTSTSSWTTGSFTPSANALLIVFFGALNSTAARTVSSVTCTHAGAGSWTERKVVTIGTTPFVTSSIWTCQMGATPGAGTVTVGTSGNETRTAIVVLEITGHNTSSPIGTDGSNSGTGTTLTVTLGATPGAVNTVIAAICNADDSSPDPIGVDAAYTELSALNSGGSTVRSSVQVDYDAGSADDTVDWSGLAGGGSDNEGGVAIEIVAASGGSSYNQAASGALTPAGGLSKQTSTSKAGGLTPAGALAALKTILRSLSGAMASAGALARRTGKVTGGSLAPAGGLVRRIGKILAGALAWIGSLVGLGPGGAVLPAGRTWTIEAEDRSWQIEREARSFVVAAEVRREVIL